MPTLQGKQAGYILRRLLEFKQGKGHPTIMDRIARGYSDEELARIASHIAADSPSPAGERP
jgi:sulfide dehydrogenase cytochrome subunit